MAHIEGRVARPERRWGCRRGTPEENTLNKRILFFRDAHNESSFFSIPVTVMTKIISHKSIMYFPDTPYVSVVVLED